MATLPRPLHAKHLGQSPQGLRRDGRRRGAHDLRPDPGHVRGQLDDVARMLAGQSPDVAAMLTDSAEDILAFRSFPTAQWRKIWSTHPLERVKREIKRRTNVVGIFPNVRRSSASSPPSALRPTTNGPSPSGATSTGTHTQPNHGQASPDQRVTC